MPGPYRNYSQFELQLVTLWTEAISYGEKHPIIVLFPPAKECKSELEIH